MVVSNSRPVMLFLDSVVPNRNLTLQYFENFRGGGNCQFPGGNPPPGNMPRINTGYVTVLRPSPSSVVVCNVKYCG